MRRPKISVETKLALLRRHLLDGEPAFKLAQEVGIDASTFHRWQRKFLRYSLEDGTAAFSRRHYSRKGPTAELNAVLRKLSTLL
jgi:transposase-like protein